MRVELEGIALEVEDHGDGVPVVLLHGFPLSSETWTPIRTAVEQAARLITPDLRGFGGSDKPQGDYAMETLAGDVLRLADRLGVERFVLGGHSMGGYVVLRLAASHVERLAGLILIDTRASADTPEGKVRRTVGIERIRRGEAAAFLDEFIPNLLGESTRGRAPRLATELRALAAEVPDHVLAGCLAGMRDRPDSVQVLSTLDLPALVITGQEDTLAPPEVAHQMAAALRRGRLAVIPLAGHTPSVERPIPTAEAILAFLREHFPPSPVAIKPRPS
jgi:pimeloyl-ACP methyl ester carboxylesterase